MDPKEIDNIKENLKGYLGKTEFEGFFDYWEGEIKKLSADYLSLKGRYYNYKKRLITGVLPPESEDVIFNNLLSSGLMLINSLSQEPNTESHSSINPIIDDEFSDSAWNLISYNQEKNTIAVAVLKIGNFLLFP